MAPTPVPVVVRRCACGAEYARHLWDALDLVDRQEVGADERGPARFLEFRRCRCGAALELELLALLGGGRGGV